MPSINSQPSIPQQMQQVQSGQSNQTNQSSQASQASQTTQQAQANQANQEAESNPQVQNGQSTQNSDASEATARQQSAFEPGEINFDRSNAQKVKPESQAEARQAAQDNLAQLRNKRIESRLNQLSEAQRRQLEAIRQGQQ